jgi:isopenicillin-N epimerase
MCADVDYPSMQYAMKWLADRRGVRVARVTVPEPATRDNVVLLRMPRLSTRIRAYGCSS